MARKTTPQRGAKAAARKPGRPAAKAVTPKRKTTAKAAAKSTGKAVAKTAARKGSRVAAAPKKAAVKRGGRVTKTTQTTKKAARRTYTRARKEGSDRRGPTRAALYAEIKKRGIPGCSRMSQEELAQVLRS